MSFLKAIYQLNTGLRLVRSSQHAKQ